MVDLVIIVSACVLIVGIGVGLLKLSQWARSENSRLTSRGLTDQDAAVSDSILTGSSADLKKGILYGSLPKTWRNVATLCAVAMIVVFVVFIVYALRIAVALF